MSDQDSAVSAERRYTESELRGYVDAINRSQAVIEFTPDGTILTANDNFLNAVGYTLDQIKGKHLDLEADVMAALRLGQGRPTFGIDLRIVDDAGNELPHDGKAEGALQVRGHWVVETYFGKEQTALTDDGWFDTGDVSTIDADGYMVIRDRTKDIIKSGGEWISSVDLEGIAVAHPGVAMAAAIGAKHPKWDERPIIVAVKAEGADPSAADVLALYEGKVAKWQIPDMVVFTDAIPLNGTGKMLKNKLREQFGDVLLETEATQ